MKWTFVTRHSHKTQEATIHAEWAAWTRKPVGDLCYYTYDHMVLKCPASLISHHQMLPRCLPEAVPGKGLDLASADRKWLNDMILYTWQFRWPFWDGEFLYNTALVYVFYVTCKGKEPKGSRIESPGSTHIQRRWFLGARLRPSSRVRWCHYHWSGNRCYWPRSMWCHTLRCCGWWISPMCGRDPAAHGSQSLHADAVHSRLTCHP